MTKKKKEKKNNIALYIGILIVIVVLIFLFRGKGSEGDGATTTPEVEEKVDVEEIIDEKKIVPAKEVEVVKEIAVEKEMIDSSNKLITNLGCDLTNLRITFTLTNPTDAEKTLKRLTTFEDASTAYKVSINGKRIRNIVEACGTETLAKGESVDCEVKFDSMEEIHNYGIKTGESYEGYTEEIRKNRISGKTLKLTDEKYFLCE